VYYAATSKLEGKELDLLIAILPDNNGSLYGMLVTFVIRVLSGTFQVYGYKKH
jgi:hypothetical protein